MGVSVSDIKALNEKIEVINKKADRAKSQSEVFLSKLNKELAEYEKKYGVKLSGDTLDETMKLIEQESKKVSERIQAEYELKVKVVTAIDRGNIAEADKLLGHVEEEPKSNSVGTSKVIEDKPVKRVEVTNSYSAVSKSSSPVIVSDDAIKGVTAKRGTVIDEDTTDVSPSNISVSAKGMMLDEEDDEDEFDFGAVVKKKELNSINSNKNIKDVFSGLEADEGDEDDDDDDFGFGELLKGSKFSN